MIACNDDSAYRFSTYGCLPVQQRLLPPVQQRLLPPVQQRFMRYVL